jgi:hypothetical protein
MPLNSIPKCLECRRFVWSRQKSFKCHVCKSDTHAKCISYNDRRSPGSHVFYCKQCLNEALPFQSVSNDDLQSIFNYTIHDLINIFNSIDDQIFDFENEIDTNLTSCKYTYKHDLGNISISENSTNELSIIHVNIRSIFMNFSALKFYYPNFLVCQI